MTGGIEIWRGGVNTWECDEMGHMNVRFYVARAMEGLVGLAAALGLPHAFAAHAGATLLVREQHIRFLREARAGAALHMTGGVVVVLGKTGRNFAAGMSGGIAFVLNEDGGFEQRCNLGMIELEPVIAEADQALLRDLILRHAQYTGSRKAKAVLDQWEAMLPKFVKVMPVEYRRVLEARKAQARKETAVHG